MKNILIVSDTHGHTADFASVYQVENEKKHIDIVVHLGDSEEYNEVFDQIIDDDCEYIAVCGNCDLSWENPIKRILEIEGNRILMMHGHSCKVRQGYDNLAKIALEDNCRIALFGHIHIPVMTDIASITLFNPGSLVFPRQADGRPSYGLMQIDGDNIDLKIQYADTILCG